MGSSRILILFIFPTGSRIPPSNERSLKLEQDFGQGPLNLHLSVGTIDGIAIEHVEVRVRILVMTMYAWSHV